MTYRKSLCVDFDRVIHQYTSTWSGPLTISDPPVEGAFAWMTEMVSFYELNVYSSRSNAPGGIEAMYAWFEQHGLPKGVLSQLVFPFHKPPAVLYIDDRAFHFTGRFPSRAEIDTFKPWHPSDKPVADFYVLAVSLTAAQRNELRAALDKADLREDT